MHLLILITPVRLRERNRCYLLLALLLLPAVCVVAATCCLRCCCYLLFALLLLSAVCAFCFLAISARFARAAPLFKN
ncbi:hypothetical protein [Methanimicrococcus blatticola]|uniref:hypothetical protein n=1 Tax=Methanimicrococcus blatticola TaxID=91560 RepID=UPI00105F88D7|nr:hypothetical protein [Methanimicrococcus blatticola]MBZ3935171.1 hypothetical protein [Methanimicrococcus blatticola]MCC2508732.1 hypothetical protein [Methanimicrococcus blatticola]